MTVITAVLDCSITQHDAAEVWSVIVFRFPDESSNSITVSMDDTLRVVCPTAGSEKRYLKIHKVSALSYNECLLETQKTLVVTCDGSESSQKPTIIAIRHFSPLPSSGSILFEPGETYYWIVNPKFSAIAHSLASYQQRRDQKVPDGVTQEQLQKVAALAQKGATGTFMFDTPTERDEERRVDPASRAEGMFWDNVPLLEDVLSGASDSILLGSNRIGDEEGAFVVHEDVARSYEYQSNSSSATAHVSRPSVLLTVLLFVACLSFHPV
ncbi:unnamed protein product [Heligmosomoides polygyrus]|uniref:Ephrin RBD domain-containing protein n=1 Tax=Heligmosomoides polygyrus TaxID=6339 RepID=A0A183G4G1_HELPZ|nr:unnamed protein product [Heligmosomoides polygyrus]